MTIQNITRQNSCPVCENRNEISTVARKNLITMQNYVYREQQKALDAQVGEFQLHSCKNCGFAYNSVFDSHLLIYDQNYDNTVLSAFFAEYYKQIASFLYHEFSLKNGFVIDVGCGKGTFLNILCDLYPDVEGLGIDPSYEAETSAIPKENPQFIREIFKEEHITRQPSLIICRHVLEHIENPLPFLNSICSASSAFPGTPFFIEVPDLDWITNNNAFWDFCYEHCNYFTADSLYDTLLLAGFNPQTVRKAFEGQYLWALGTIKPSDSEALRDEFVSDRLVAYSQSEKTLILRTGKILKELKEKGNLLAIWGMATKGILLCNLVDPDKYLFDFCIDSNPKKHQCFVPHTEHLIHLPQELAQIGSAKLVIVVMNPNYLQEINKTCQGLNLNPLFIDANGNTLNPN